MTKIPRVSPLFYEALTGEFKPYTETDETHTLGKLVIATLFKGTTNDASPYIDGLCIKYRPSWAPQVEASAEIDVNRIVPTLLNIVLTANNGASLGITDHTLSDEDGDPNQITITPTDLEQVAYLSAEPGKQLTATRVRIATMAQDFFRARAQ